MRDGRSGGRGGISQAPRGQGSRSPGSSPNAAASFSTVSAFGLVAPRSTFDTDVTVMSASRASFSCVQPRASRSWRISAPKRLGCSEGIGREDDSIMRSPAIMRDLRLQNQDVYFFKASCKRLKLLVPFAGAGG